VRRTAISVLLGVGTSLLAVPAAAEARAVITDLPCYLERRPATATLTGFTPNVDVQIRGDQIQAAGVTDATGSLALAFAAPSRGTARPGSTKVTLTATELTGPARSQRATVAFRVATFGFATSGGTTSPKARRTWSFSGFRPGRPIYGHFRFKGRTRANFRFGVASGPCGELRKRAPGFPVRGRLDAGTWRVQVDQKPTYSRSTTPKLATNTTIVTRFVPRAVGL
jgi:hypothetical protein